MAKLDDLRSEILDELGADVYSVYDKERHLVPDAVLISIASALIAEFLKGLIDPKTLGAQAREKIDQFVRNIAAKKDLELPPPDGELTTLIQSAKESKGLDPSRLSTAQKNVQSALSKLGMSDGVAVEHAKAISSLVASNLLKQ